ncbi:hypothetical protein [Paraburkholderia rhizosphaerae]|uniref:Uncharacterized protein n=1 Tax=Paraburkholderia rhizosphaerae TaxID=480658 RepID=A0A4R8LQN7_9BURK|nr:hypothetical protein [Paraburkholderia rhizosphaerae]TDY49879.1 hypothetical protein BX592_110132 [Paraburkholderia rhizosphaerae]
MWKARIAAVVPAALLLTPLFAFAQQSGTTAPVVQWKLQVMQNGEQIDAFDGTTTVGQARTDTHHHVVQHDVGCKDQPAGSIDLQRTVTVTPIVADASGVTLAVDAQETLEDAGPQRTSPSGCKLPPQPRQVSASHPGLRAPPGDWASWQIIDKDPQLVYRVSASVANTPAQQ